jgi:hypothetical protein
LFSPFFQIDNNSLCETGPEIFDFTIKGDSYNKKYENGSRSPSGPVLKPDKIIAHYYQNMCKFEEEV